MVTIEVQADGGLEAVLDVTRRAFGADGARVADLVAAEATGDWGVILEGAPAYYGRFGFVPAGRHGLLRPSERIPQAAFQVVLLPAHEEWMRGRVVYPDRFWAFDAVGLRG